MIILHNPLPNSISKNSKMSVVSPKHPHNLIKFNLPAQKITHQLNMALNKSTNITSEKSSTTSTIKDLKETY